MEPDEEAHEHHLDGPEEVEDDEMDEEEPLDWDHDDLQDKNVNLPDQLEEWPEEGQDWDDDVDLEPESDLDIDTPNEIVDHEDDINDQEHDEENESNDQKEEVSDP